MNDLTLLPTPLNKCLFGFGLPLEKDVFLKESQSESHKDFAKKFKRGLNDNFRWEEYNKNVAKQAKAVMTYAEKMGVHVISNFTIEDMKYAQDYDVVTIVGHWLNKEEKVELADATHSVNEFVSAIPQNTKCMLDLTICQSVILLDEIKKRFGSNVIVFGNSISISIQICLFIYEQTIREMIKNENLNFLDAVHTVKKGMINKL